MKKYTRSHVYTAIILSTKFCVINQDVKEGMSVPDGGYLTVQQNCCADRCEADLVHGLQISTPPTRQWIINADRLSLSLHPAAE